MFCVYKIALKQQQKTGKLHKKPLSRNSTPQIPILLKNLLKFVCFKNLYMIDLCMISTTSELKT